MLLEQGVPKGSCKADPPRVPDSKHPLSFGLFADTIWNGGFNFQSRRFFAFTQTYDEFSGDENSLMEEFPSSILRYFSKNGN